MGYQRKMVIYGNLREYTQYEREVKTGSQVSSPKGIQQRVVDPFKKRRADNVYSTKRNFMRRVLCAIEEIGSPLFITCTYGRQTDDVAVGYKDLYNFILRLRRKFGRIETIAVPEFHKSGKVHFHLLLFGLSGDRGDLWRGKASVEYGSERDTRELADIWGHGWLDCRRTYGDVKLAAYMSKYMTKGLMDVRLTGLKAYYCTRGIPKPVVLLDSGIDIVLSETKMNVISEVRIRSAWLGNVKKQVYERKANR